MQQSTCCQKPAFKYSRTKTFKLRLYWQEDVNPARPWKAVSILKMVKILLVVAFSVLQMVRSNVAINDGVHVKEKASLLISSNTGRTRTKRWESCAACPVLIQNCQQSFFFFVVVVVFGAFLFCFFLLFSFFFVCRYIHTIKIVTFFAILSSPHTSGKQADKKKRKKKGYWIQIHNDKQN